MLYLRTSIPFNMFFSIYRCEMLRTERTVSSKLIFSNSSKNLVTIMCKQGGRIKTFFHILAKIFGKHSQTFQKFFPTSSILT